VIDGRPKILPVLPIKPSTLIVGGFEIADGIYAGIKAGQMKAADLRRQEHTEGVIGSFGGSRSVNDIAPLAAALVFVVVVGLGMWWFRNKAWPWLRTRMADTNLSLWGVSIETSETS